MKIECIKGLMLGGSIAIMQGEIFRLVDSDENIFIGIDGLSRCPGMEINFTEEQLVDNFKYIHD